MKHAPLYQLIAAPLVLLTTHSAIAESPNSDTRLIAHRGGVVDDNHIEHSIEGLKAAIERGYWMVEIDVRETKDGHPLVHHDRDFRRYYGDSRRVAELNWNEIRQLQSEPGNSRPLLLTEFLELCQGKVRLMLEIKGPAHSVQFYKSIEKMLREKNLLEDAYMIGIPEAKTYFKDKLRTSLQRDGLSKAIAAGEPVSERYFLFEAAKMLDEETNRIARELNVPVVAALNRHHYDAEAEMQQASEDIARMKGLGVRLFQIDSIYDRFLLK